MVLGEIFREQTKSIYVIYENELNIYIDNKWSFEKNLLFKKYVICCICFLLHNMLFSGNNYRRRTCSLGMNESDVIIQITGPEMPFALPTDDLLPRKLVQLVIIMFFIHLLSVLRYG